jgi:hypothetical protein
MQSDLLILAVGVSVRGSMAVVVVVVVVVQQ